MKLLKFIEKLHREESGQDLVEYALVLVAIAGGVFAASTNLSDMLGAAVTSLNTKIQTYFV